MIKISNLKLHRKFRNEIETDEKDINDKIDRYYFNYQRLSFLAKYLLDANQDENEQLVNNINGRLIDLRNAVVKKEIFIK